jgi:hypothetical protein
MANLQRCALTAMGGDRDGWRERESEARPELSRGEDDPERQLVQTPGFEGRLRACAAPLMAPSGCVGGWRWRRGASQLYNLQGAAPRHAPTTQCRIELVDGGERVAVLRLLCTMAKSVWRRRAGRRLRPCDPRTGDGVRGFCGVRPRRWRQISTNPVVTRGLDRILRNPN